MAASRSRSTGLVPSGPLSGSPPLAIRWPGPSPRGGGMVNASYAALPLIASAAAAKSAGQRATAMRLLSRAQAQQRSDPTYYGGAWAALGPALLTSGALGAC